MLIKSINLLSNQNLIFELKQLNIFILIYLIDHDFSQILIYNNINLLIILIKYTRFDKIFEYKIEKYYLIQINIKYVFLINKFFIKIKSKILIK